MRNPSIYGDPNYGNSSRAFHIQQTFTHCLLYSSTCPSIGLTFIPAGQEQEVDVCLQTFNFQTMFAMRDKVPCSFMDIASPAILPIWSIPIQNPLSVSELESSNGLM